MMQVGLYVVATPIGNLQDMTFRAITTLQSVALVLVEDTRQARKLWDAYGINTPMCIANQHTEKKCIARVLSSLAAGEAVALISDAGTPLIHDPGAMLLPAVIAKGHAVIPIPGACAAITALSAAGVDASQFHFCGFLPIKRKEAEAYLEAWSTVTVPLVFYEAPHRVLSTLSRIIAVFGEARDVILARELTKRYEDIQRMSLGDLQQALSTGAIPVKGEMVMIVAGVSKTVPSLPESVTMDIEKMVPILLDVVSVKDAATLLSRLSGLSHSKAYAACLAAKNRDHS